MSIDTTQIITDSLCCGQFLHGCPSLPNQWGAPRRPLFDVMTLFPPLEKKSFGKVLSLFCILEDNHNLIMYPWNDTVYMLLRLLSPMIFMLETHLTVQIKKLEHPLKWHLSSVLFLILCSICHISRDFSWSVIFCDRVFAVRLVLTGPAPCELVDAKICLTFRIFVQLPSGSMFCSTQNLELVRPEVKSKKCSTFYL